MKSTSITMTTPALFQPEVITFGETMALMMPDGSKGIEYASHMIKSFGGAETNVAIGLARLGHQVGWCGRLGKDPFGRMILKIMRGEGVDVSRVELTDEAPTGLMLREVTAGKTSVYYYRRHSAASFMQPDHLDESYIAQAKLLHITGITPALSDTCKQTLFAAIKLAKRHGVQICFDPNLRLKLWSIEEARETLLPLAQEADYFLPGLDEMKLLYQTEDDADVIARLQELPGTTILKGGKVETFIVDKHGVQSVPYFKVERVVDTIGAGDGFCSGFIAGVLRNQSLYDAVRLGNLIGSMVVQTEGDWEGLPTWEQVEAILNNKAHVER